MALTSRSDFYQDWGGAALQFNYIAGYAISMKIAVVFLFLTCVLFAHQPRIVEGTGVVEIKNPEISQAFYGALSGTPAVFEIKSDAPFRLYAGITVPAIQGAKTDKSVKVTVLDSDGVEKEVFFLNASREWKPFYEEFAGDDYFQGPEARVDASAGTYRITVSSPDNTGKYCLAIGETESFGVTDTLNAIVLLPTLKSWFFGKPPSDAIFTKIYLFAFLPVFGIAAFLALGVWALRRFVLKKAQKTQTGRRKG
jgi:hypothetical protein